MYKGALELFGGRVDAILTSLGFSQKDGVSERIVRTGKLKGFAAEPESVTRIGAIMRSANLKNIE